MQYNGSMYFYVRNAQGDIIKLIDSTGAVVVEYAYDAWGKLMSTTGSLATTLGVDNPYRYRGYRYDNETGLYYLQSRYYNPEWGRFVNADSIVGQVGHLGGHNAFAYCFNNPVMHSDYTGEWPQLSTILTVVAIAAAVIAVGALCVATAGAAAVVIAGVSAGGAAVLGGGASVAGVIAGSLAVAATAGKVSAIAAAAAVVSNDVEKKLERNYTVYTLLDPDTQSVEYVGRTKDWIARENAHKNSLYRSNLEAGTVIHNLNYYEARGLEQIGMLYYHTINPKNHASNIINGISPNNPNLKDYMNAGRAISNYISNQISNEILNWMEK